MADNLEEHIERRHGNKQKKGNAKLRQLLGGMVKKENSLKDGKIKSVEIEKKFAEEAIFKRTKLTSILPVPKNGAILLKSDIKSSKLVAEAGQTAGNGNICPVCAKEFPKKQAMRTHFEDIHQPGEFPCSGCHKIFTSRNKMSSHYLTHCNPNRKSRRTL